MKLKGLILLFAAALLYSCADSGKKIVNVSNSEELSVAIDQATPGTEIVMSDGVWKDIQIRFKGVGTEAQPITLRAETAGGVSIEGISDLKLAGEYLVVSGLYFHNGYNSGKNVIEFRIKDELANNCRVTNCVIDEFTKPNRFDSDHWIVFWGRHNQVDHCYIGGKFNEGPVVKVYLAGNENTMNYHQITNNYFGPRPRKGGPKAETMQLGASFTSMTPSHTNVSNNFFDRCDGEVEVISNKSNHNEYRNNVFYKCEGSLVLRHGNYCIVDGNIFIGDDKNPFYGGIRVINTGHWVTNNYFYKINGDEFRSPLAIMNGIHKSPLNRYNQVTDVVVAHNTWVDCMAPWQFSVGVNTDKADVLPPSEIRGARPLRTVIANNLVYNSETSATPVKAYDKVDGVLFESNLINNQGGDESIHLGMQASEFSMEKIAEGLYMPAAGQEDVLSQVYAGFDFQNIKTDLMGNSRKTANSIGASLLQGKKPTIDKSQYGASWFSNEREKVEPNTITVTNAEGDLAQKLEEAKSGDILILDAGTYAINSSLVVNKTITIKAADKANPTRIVYSGNTGTPAFEMQPKGTLTLEDIVVEGNGSQHAFATLKENNSNAFNLTVVNSKINNFDYLLNAYQGSYADTIKFISSKINDCQQGLFLASETSDRGDYNVEVVVLENNTFNKVHSNVVNYYRGGYDESTIGGGLYVDGNTFTNCGAKEKSKILLQTYGIVNVKLNNNTFTNNPVKHVCVLWGEKNNTHSGNELNKSGKLTVEQHLKQKLVY